MSEDEDQRWLDALAGRPVSKTSDAAGIEARALRDLISAHLRADITVVADVDAFREAALIERARAEGLVSAQRVTAIQPRRRRWFIAGGSLAAAALLASVVVQLYRSSLPAAETYRGVQDGTVRLESRDPDALKQELIRELAGPWIDTLVNVHPSIGLSPKGPTAPEPSHPRPSMSSRLTRMAMPSPISLTACASRLMTTVPRPPRYTALRARRPPG